MNSRMRHSAGKLVASCTLLYFGYCGEAPYGLTTFHFSHPDDSLEAHGLFGEALGRAFAEGTMRRLRAWPSLQKKMLPATKTQHGSRVYDEFLRIHEHAFPTYMEELRGIARGSRVPFEWIFVAQLQEEFKALLYQGEPTTSVSYDADHCSDYMLCSAERCVDAHNEDGDKWNINATAIVDVRLGKTQFKAFTYMGELPSGAFAVNKHGLGFSVNYVGPPISKPGIGRGFVTRNMLEATDMRELRAMATQAGQSGGHNFQLFDFCRRSILNLEVAQDEHAVLAINTPAFFHANQYQTLNVPGEHISDSSTHRLRRVLELPEVHSLEDILAVLGDQGDSSYPIFHDELSHSRGELSDWTLATAVFDLDNRTVSILKGNPTNGRLWSVWNVSALMTSIACSDDPSILVI